jgi:hypothetical protein
MSDVDTQYDTADEASAPAGDDAPVEVTEADMISRGKGLSPNAVAELADDDPRKIAFEEFKQLQTAFAEAKEALAEATEARNQGVYVLKSQHDIGFSAIAEIMDVSSSMVLYTYERAQGKTAKQIREESVKSRLAKEQFQESDPNRKPVRKQTPEEKALRKKLREELQAFLKAQRESGANDEISDDEVSDDDGDDT